MNDKATFFAQTSVNVYGVVSGKTTIVTADNSSISIVDDGKNSSRGNSNPGIVYQDFSVASGTAGVSSNDNMLGLVTGKDIVYNPAWNKTVGSGKTGSLQFDTIKNNLGTANVINVNACLVATETPLSCEEWDNKDHADNSNLNSATNYYRLRLFGSHVVSTYRSVGETGRTSGKARGANAGTIGHEYIYDKRLAQDVNYPNATLARTVPGADGKMLLVLTSSKWSMSNVKQ